MTDHLATAIEALQEIASRRPDRDPEEGRAVQDGFDGGESWGLAVAAWDRGCRAVIALEAIGAPVPPPFDCRELGIEFDDEEDDEEDGDDDENATEGGQP